MLVKTGTLICCRLTNSHERFERFQERVTRQLDLAWLQQELGFFLADIPDHAWLGDLPSNIPTAWWVPCDALTPCSALHARGQGLQLPIRNCAVACSAVAELTCSRALLCAILSPAIN